MIVEPSSEQKRKRSFILNDSMNKEMPIEKSKKKRDIRSGRSYYEQWDKYAIHVEKVLNFNIICMHLSKNTISYFFWMIINYYYFEYQRSYFFSNL